MDYGYPEYEAQSQYLAPHPVLVSHHLYPAPPHLARDAPLAWPPDQSPSSFSAPFSMPYSPPPPAPYSSPAPPYQIATFSAYESLPSPAPFPPPRLSPPRLPHSLHNLSQTDVQLNDLHATGGLHLINPNPHLHPHPNAHRPTLAGSLDPSTGIFYRSPEHPRLRTAQACEKCRTRKAKCSGEHPSCKRCTTRGLVCEYAKEGRVRGPNKPKVKVEHKLGEAVNKKARKEARYSPGAVPDVVGNRRGKEKDKASGKVRSTRVRVKEESRSPGSRPRRPQPENENDNQNDNQNENDNQNQNQNQNGAARNGKYGAGSSSPGTPEKDYHTTPADLPLSTSVPLERALSMGVGLPLSMSAHRASRARPPDLLLHTPSHHHININTNTNTNTNHDHSYDHTNTHTNTNTHTHTRIRNHNYPIDNGVPVPRSTSFHSSPTPPLSGASVGGLEASSSPLPLQSHTVHGQREAHAIHGQREAYTPTGGAGAPGSLYGGGSEAHAMVLAREYLGRGAERAGVDALEGEYGSRGGGGYEQCRERYSEHQQQQQQHTWSHAHAHTHAHAHAQNQNQNPNGGSTNGTAYNPPTTTTTTTSSSSSSPGVAHREPIMVYRPPSGAGAAYAPAPSPSDHAGSYSSGTTYSSDTAYSSGTTYVASDGSATAYLASSGSSYGSERPGTGGSGRPGSGGGGGGGGGYEVNGHGHGVGVYAAVPTVFGYRFAGGEACVGVESVG
ncbi:hypothetical protein BDZ94DRAFT_1297661 [Collybia nuda]|uniref:Zn(2)-C6 fungal-type domain-containing protein n=1 Tax=Collybia nuda TaxID=64659 RepID=A0A9P6CJ03_9AGAR|nr:hypothetical protein BDZ94DRAFT_1297661 [Collybia nuda]